MSWMHTCSRRRYLLAGGNPAVCEGCVELSHSNNKGYGSSTEFTCAALTVLQVLRFFKAADGLPDLNLCRSPFLRESGSARFDKRRAEAEGKMRGPYRRYSTAQKNALLVRQ